MSRVSGNFASTGEAENFVRNTLQNKRDIIKNVNVSRVSRDDPTTTVLFADQNYNVVLETVGGFCIGYNGRGPCGIYDILLWLGFKDADARAVFEQGRQRMIVRKL